MNPALVDDQAPVSAELTGFGGGAVMRPGRDRAERINESAFIRDVWYVLGPGEHRQRAADAGRRAGRGVRPVPADGPHVGHHTGPGSPAG